MRRVDENDEGVSQYSGFKKARFFNGIDESDGVLGGTQGEEERVFAENGAIDSAEIDGKSGSSENEISGDFGSSSLAGLKQADKLDFGLIVGHHEQREDFDLNVPFFQGFTPDPLIDQKRAEIIDIESDSDDEVEIVGFSRGNEANYKQIATLMSDDRNCGGGEEGMTKSWLSLNSFYPIELDLRPEIPMDISEPREDVEVMAWQSEAMPAVPDFIELELRREEQALGLRAAEVKQAYLRRSGKEFSRMNHLDENSGNGTSNQVKNSHPLNHVEGLGNSPGPFAEGLKLVRERTSKGAPQYLIEWKPSQENVDHRINAPLVPSLLDLSLKALAENAEGLVSLELVPDMLRRRLTDMLCDTSRMSVHVLDLLVKGYPTAIRIKNCSQLTEKQFQQAFSNCQTKNLMVLQLDLGGQIMLELLFRDMSSQSSNNFSSLAILSLKGACRLPDSGLKELVLAAPNLQSINLGQCSLLTSDGINFIADILGSNLRELYIDDCPKINAIQILPSFRKFKCLEVLSVAESPSVTDQFIRELIISCGQSIKELDLANCQKLTDCSLQTVGSKCVDLRALNISYLNNLTDLGMEHLANSCKSIQKLKLCRNIFSDEAIASFLESCGGSLTELSLNNVRKVGPNSALSLAKCSRKLLSLDLSWCRGLTDESVGLIVDNCSSLKQLKVFGCKQITPLLIYGHSNPLIQIVGLNLNPILKNTDLLEPEETLLRYSPLSLTQV